MTKTIKLRKGLDIKLKGEAEKYITRLPRSTVYGIAPAGFPGISPKLLVQAGENVEAGTPLFFDKRRPEIVVTSPVSGVVEAVERGDKRAVLNVVVRADEVQRHRKFDIPARLTREATIELLLASGLWPCIIQRPYGIVATPADMPKAVFVSGFDSAPLAPDLNFALEAEFVNLKRGFEVLRTLAAGRPVHLSLSATSEGVLDAVGDEEGIVKHTFAGPHPAGNVGVQISHIDPVNKGDRVWTADLWNVALIGRFFNTGRLDMTKIYAVAGSGVGRTGYVEASVGTPIADLVRATGSRAAGDERLRFISGNALSGRRVGEDGYIGFYANMLTVLPEGDRYELLGWARPGLNKFSVSRTYLSWLRPGKKYVIDTNLRGGQRPFIVTGLFERYMPMDIYPMQLLKAILAQDIDKMEALGIYEVLPEDLALCEFADPSKNDIQQIVQDGIDLMVKEVG